jgi:hypothetical protein
VLPALAEDEPRRALLPFYEANFSNYIEGTEFTLDEAAEIVFEHVVPEQRPQDAHDVLGTYQLTSAADVMTQTPASGPELLDLLTRRHAVLLGSRLELSRAKSSGAPTLPARPSSSRRNSSKERCCGGSK